MTHIQLVRMWLQRLTAPARAFSTTACVEGRKTREPFDRRFPLSVTSKHGSRLRKGGSEMMEKYLAVHNVRPTGMFDKKVGHFRNVPEMIPEFIVPDLTDFPLKPYVSYKVPEIHQNKMTARELFQATYGAQLTQDYKDGKVVIKDGQFVKVHQGEEKDR